VNSSTLLTHPTRSSCIALIDDVNGASDVHMQELLGSRDAQVPKDPLELSLKAFIFEVGRQKLMPGGVVQVRDPKRNFCKSKQRDDKNNPLDDMPLIVLGSRVRWKMQSIGRKLRRRNAHSIRYGSQGKVSLEACCCTYQSCEI
jgi:hypothetical protein